MAKTPAEGAQRFKHAPDTAWRRIDDEAVVLDLRTSVYYSLNDTAALIWECIGEGLTTEAIVERLAEDFDPPREAARRDVQELLRDLSKNELIVPA